MFAAYPGDLGDVICSNTVVCQAAENAVQQMDSVYQANVASLTNYQSSHDTIMSSYNANYSSLEDYIPFNPNCCTMQTIGQQAYDLMIQMQTALGQNPTPGGGNTLGITGYIVLAAVGYLIFVYAASHK